jgi:hypothetical protein
VDEEELKDGRGRRGRKGKGREGRRWFLDYINGERGTIQ